MISDVLFEATNDLRHYLTHPTFDLVYGAAVRVQLAFLVERMELLQVMLGQAISCQGRAVDGADNSKGDPE